MAKRRPKERPREQKAPQALAPGQVVLPVRPPLPSLRFRAAAALLLVVLAFAAHWSALDAGFVFDDQALVLRNPYIKSLSNVPKFFGMNWWDMSTVKADGVLYRPFAAVTFAVDYVLMGGAEAEAQRTRAGKYALDPRLMHVSNVVFHAITCILLFELLLRLLGVPGWGALAGAALFAVHPVHAEAVMVIVGRTEVLSGMFLFASWLALLAADRSARPLAWRCFAAALWLLGLFSKEMAVMLPAFVIIADYAWGGRRRFVDWVRVFAPFLVAAIVYGWMRHTALSGQAIEAMRETRSAPDASAWLNTLFTTSYAFLWYLKLLIWPASLSIDYTGFPILRSFSDPRAFYTLVLHVFLLAFSVRLLWKRRLGSAPGVLLAVAAAVVSFYAGLFPVSNLALNVMVLFSERALYIPSFALSLAVGAAAASTLAPSRSRRTRVVGAAVLGVIVLGGCFWAFHSNRLWCDEPSIYEASARNPNSGTITMMGLARIRMQRGDYAGALVYAERSRAVGANLINLEYQAECLLKLGRRREAIEPLRTLFANKVMRFFPRLIEAMVAEGQDDAARKLLQDNRALITPGPLLDAAKKLGVQ